MRADYADRDDIPARYARAIATYRLNDVPGAVRAVDELIGREPDNPYFRELKGQILFESGRVEAAVAPYRAAVARAPDTPLFKLGLGRALLQSGRPGEAIGPLEAVVRAEPRNAFAWRTLGIAHGRTGDIGESNLALAEAALLQRRLDDAGLYLARAEEHVGGSASRQHLADLKNAFETARDARR